MTNDQRRVPPGFHEGELTVQQQAGVRAEASRLRRMLDPAHLNGGAARFLAGQNFAVLSGCDRRGRLWVSPLTAPAGFLEVTDTNTLRVHTHPAPDDPLHDLPAGQQVGLLVIDFAKRRRYRINGWLTDTTAAWFTIEADQAYGNCPQYIQQRDLTTDEGPPTGPSRDPNAETRPADPTTSAGTAAGTPAEGTQLADADVAQVAAADTIFLGTTHPNRGGDASHRGGPPGFVRVEDERHLWWPDYPGNNMFNSLGNLAVDPTAALQFCDFTSGRTLHLSGTARLQRTALGVAGDDAGTGRRVSFTVELTVLGPPTTLRATPRLPPRPTLTD